MKTNTTKKLFIAGVIFGLLNTFATVYSSVSTATMEKTQNTWVAEEVIYADVNGVQY